ncbi:NAD(P)H-binding protein [Pendulispora rubella]|uniref:NAD(P)H-binding protein n=1 Tax=Pendulispora rubella TaxID=2741070 RepID=A0ABZ2KPC4_9BACT
MSSKVLLIGATGRTGRLLADSLVGEPEFELTALVRRPGYLLPGAKVLRADLTGDYSSAFKGITHVIYAAGSTETDTEAEEKQIDRDAVVRAAEYAKAHHVQQLLVISALSAYWPERSIESLRHYSQMKREGDDGVIASGVNYVILRPGALSDEPGTGTIGVTEMRLEHAPLVARQDVARTTLEAIKLGISRKTIGFVGGSVPIRRALKDA